jgi:hypothetical protein
VTAADAILTCIGIGKIPVSPSFSSLSEEQIVNRMQMHDRAHMKMLGSYQAQRHDAIEYRGFFKTLTASMDFEINYDASSGKRFRIISKRGSHVLCEKVLQRAVESEKKASLNRSATAWTRANYIFHLTGSDRLNGRPAYVLDVEPIAPSKLLYRGRIWVDGIDFAVAKMEVQPSKAPSFWLSRTVIHHVNKDVDGFWLPQQTRSEIKVRVGGSAVMTIDYGSYRIVPRQSVLDQ